jgi:glycosyltransferase involved in cell wall biosynthesis
VVGTICALREEKCLPVLLDAFAHIARPGRKLVIVGSGPMREQLEEQCRHLSLTSYCHFEPTTHAVASWLHSMDVFVLPSRTEGLSNALMEAMACGCAVVASEVGGNPELVRPGKTGLLFPSGDAPALAAALEKLAEHPELRATLAQAAVETSRQEFLPSVSTRRMEQIYAGCLDTISGSTAL